MSVRLPYSTLSLVAWRSLFLEASWNDQGQQNLGLAASIDPALRKIHEPGEDLRRARLRALDFFNTNPMASGMVIGVILRLEEEIAAGRLALEDAQRVAANLSRTLAAMGDALFWQAWLPFCCLAAVWAVLSLGIWWTPWLLPILFCLPALTVRFLGLFLGYRRGENVIDLLFKLKIQRLAQNTKRTVALVAGVSTVILLSTRTGLTRGEPLSPPRLWLATVAVVACVFSLRLLSTKTRVMTYWYPAFLVIAAGILLFALDRLRF